MNPFRILKQILSEIKCSRQLLTEMKDGLAALIDLTNQKVGGEHKAALSSCKEALAQVPLLLADKTFNTSHPDYNAHAVRNYPGRIFNGDNSSKNAVYRALSSLMRRQQGLLTIDDHSWSSILDEMLNEVRTILHSEQVFERKAFIENYVADLSGRYGAHYIPGWVNLEDALFLYWLVRMLKPKTVVQTGVCNGLSSAFMVLALVKNGGEGKLYAIDLPPIFNPHDPAWTVKDKVYGVVIPEGKSSGWIVPDAYRDRIEIQCGDAKALLPGLINKLDNVDAFYHDSDHTYHHMMFEFNEVKRKLVSGGVVIGDDISWNESLWDFADQYKVPAYNYKGSVGAAFF